MSDTDPAAETIAARARLEQLRGLHHGSCVVCNPAVAHGLRVEYAPAVEGGVAAVFPCDPAYEGYDGFVHGGILASLIDGAMTNCLFAQGIAAFTADLSLRYRHPVRLEEPVRVRAWLEGTRHGLHTLGGEIRQGSSVAVTGRGKFMARE